MIASLNRWFKKLVTKILFPGSKLLYAQQGEDAIINTILYKKNIKNPYYLDIGANRPKHCSNTYSWYFQGANGVLVEPNPILAKKLKKYRNHDIVLAYGVCADSENGTIADLYVFSKYDALSTFSKKDVDYWKNIGMKKIGKISHDKIIKVQLLPINEILSNYCKKLPDILSLDIEGLDLDILKSLDFERFPIPICCVETLLYGENQKESKNMNLINFMLCKGYIVYADTFVNTIFIKKDWYEKD